MSNLISLEEAAQYLGIPVDQLTELISKGEIRGLKSGSTFKFKQADLDRYKANPGGADSASDDLSAEFNLLEDDELSLAPEGGSDILASGEEASSKSPSDTGKMVEGSDLLLADDDLFDDQLSLAAGDDVVDSDSNIDDSDLVLDEDSSSELGLAAAESGINLSPSDSGLSLEEEPAEVASDLDSLSLPEDDSLMPLSDLNDDLQADDDFMLSPVEDLSDDETSGSQVIALDDSEIYPDDSVSGLLADSGGLDGDAPVLVAEEGGLFDDFSGGQGQVSPIAAPISAEPPEASYTIFQVLSLLMILTLVGLPMLLAIDNARNMWNRETASPISGVVADFFIGMVGLDSQ